jgi:hypothetical protein
MTIEQLLLFVLFLLVPLLQFIGRWLQRDAEQRRRRDDGKRRVLEPVSRPTRSQRGVASSRGAESPTFAESRDVTAVVPRRRRQDLRLSGPADARRGVVLMTILGPCRALEGYYQRPGSSGRPGRADGRSLSRA